MPRKKKLFTETEKKERRAEASKRHAKRNKEEKKHGDQLDYQLSVVGTRNKEIRDMDLRLRLCGKRTVDRINVIVDEFTLLDQQIKIVRNTKKNRNRVSSTIRRNTSRGQILKTQADILFRKLNKLLPDIKSIEHNGIFKPSKPDSMEDEKLVDILKNNVSIEDIKQMFPQYADVMKTLEGMDLPDLPE